MNTLNVLGVQKFKEIPFHLLKVVRALSDITNTPRTPSNLKTPIVAKTPQGILKSAPTTGSASKKRRVIFAPKEEEKKRLVNDSDSSDSPEFSVDVGVSINLTQSLC